MNLLKFYGPMLENIHENVMIFHANFMDLLSSSVSQDEQELYQSKVVGKYVYVPNFCSMYVNFTDFTVNTATVKI